MYCKCNTFSAHRKHSQKRPHVVDHISAANRKARLMQKNYFPREGVKFLSRGSKKIPVMYLVDSTALSIRKYGTICQIATLL